MSCRRVSRELLERFRFGEELGLSSEPHLAHLQSCPACLAEVGLDRALVVQLRNALRARVAGAPPAPGNWAVVRERAISADPWPVRLAAAWRWFRLAPAAVAMSLMIFAVAVADDSERPVAIQEERFQVLRHIPIEEPEWEMPWWLAAREGPPPAPQAHGPLAVAVNGASHVTSAGPFAEFVQ
jgi:anti-sigma factor RsiW